MNPLKMLWDDFGQAVWLDYIERDLVTGDGLAELVRNDGVRGVTSNPSIFKQAIAGGEAYDGAVDKLLAADPSISTVHIYEALVIEDIRMATDVMRRVYDISQGYDGYVSLEVSPHLANDSDGTVAEAKRLWQAVDRPNLMIKVPATRAGIPAIEELIASGINVNATLIFSLEHYEGTAQAYIRGLERCEQPGGVASVASFFVSRVDSAVDKQLDEMGSEAALALRGKAAINNACVAYSRFIDLFHGNNFAPLNFKGARVQRPLWASTSTKNPDYRDVLYVEELIGTETVNTIPTKTLAAFREHGRPRASLQEAMDNAPEVLGSLAQMGIDLDVITAQLQVDGVKAFADAYDALIEVLEAKRRDRGGRD